MDVSPLDVVFPQIDTLICKCWLCHIYLYIGVIYEYIPPSVPSQTSDPFSEELEQTVYLQSKRVVLLGDFNSTNFIFDTKKSAINSLLNVLNLQQCNNFVNDTGRVLDLVLSRINCTVIRENLSLVPEDIPYHPALDVTLENISTRATVFPQLNDLGMYNFHKANFPGLYEELFFADWSFLDNLTDLNLGTKNSTLLSTIHLIYNYVPKYLSHYRKYPPWFTSDIIRNIKRKAKLLRNFKHSGNIPFLNEFKYLVMYNRIYTAVHRSLSPFQHGFLAQRSTATNFITFTQKAIADCVDRQSQLDVIYTDFAKVFYRINHNILLSKLSLFGFDTSALTFIEIY
nr:unnamed protein product [Callosobruchus chinensis]